MNELEVLENAIMEESPEIIEETVSMGDFVSSGNAGETTTSLTVEDITLAVESALFTAEVTVLDDETLWTKPLEEYTVTEGFLLILVLCAIGLVISKVIGGVLNCKWLLKK